jgi:hypothetical protein
MQVGYNVVIGGERPVEPLYERKTDFEFWRDLCWRFGYQEYFPWRSEEELWDYCFKGLNITFRELCQRKKNWLYSPPIKYKKYEEVDPDTGKPKGFATPTGKVELYSTILEKLGYDPLPHYEEPPESPVSTPELAREYPLILITGARFRYMFHSEYRQLASIRKITPIRLLKYILIWLGNLESAMETGFMLRRLGGGLDRGLNLLGEFIPRLLVLSMAGGIQRNQAKSHPYSEFSSLTLTCAQTMTLTSPAPNLELGL